MGKEIEKRRRGRPRSEAAKSHDEIVNAVYELLHDTSVRDLTIETIARHAGVGKPTIYKWWPSKAALVLDVFEERIVRKLSAPGTKPAEQATRGQAKGLTRWRTGSPARSPADLTPAGQTHA